MIKFNLLKTHKNIYISRRFDKPDTIKSTTEYFYTHELFHNNFISALQILIQLNKRKH